MDYIILKSDGSLQTSSLNRYIQQGSTGVDKIFIGWDDALVTDAMSVLFTLPNQTTRVEIYSQTYEANYNYDGTHTSKGWIVTLYSEETNYNGSVFAAVRVVRGGIVQVAYPFVLIINETGVRPDVDSGVTIEDLDSYLVNIETLVGNAVRDNTDSQLSNTSENPVQNKVVKAALDEIIGGVYKPAGSISVSDLNSLTKEAALNGNVYNMLDAGSLVNEDSSTVSVQVGDNVVFLWNEGSWYFDSLVGLVDLSNYYTKNADLTPTTDRTYSVGTNTKTFVSGYFGTVYVTYSTYLNYIKTNTNGTLTFHVLGADPMYLSSTTLFTLDIVPKTTETEDLGSTSRVWRYAYVTEYYAKGSNASAVLKTNGYNGVLGLDSVNTLEYGTGAFWTNVADFDLGTSSHKWRDIYLTGKAYLYTNTNYIFADSSYVYVAWNNSNKILVNGSDVIINNRLRPYSNNSEDLGSSSYAWKNAYFSGLVYFAYPDQSNFPSWSIRSWGSSGLDIVVNYNNANHGTKLDLTAYRPIRNNDMDLGTSSYKWKDIWGNTLKGFATLTQAQYDALVSSETVDSDTFYFIEEE